MREAINDVREFHAKHGFAIGEDLTKRLDDEIAEQAATDRLRAVAMNLGRISRDLEIGKAAGVKDLRLLRAHLIIEEVGELIAGLAERDEIKLLDGMADSEYVIKGTAVAYDMPLAEAFDEVQSSNMTKNVNGSDRLRDKGRDFVPPNLERVLRYHREPKIAAPLNVVGTVTGRSSCCGGPNLSNKPKTIRPTIVCLCGSTRFSEAFQKANFEETLAGRIVLSIGCDTKADEGLALTSDDKARLDKLHFCKIDIADEVLILNVGGYIGESTAREVEYAKELKKPIRYLEPFAGHTIG